MLDPEQRVTTLREIVHRLPRYNFDLLKRISQHLYESATSLRLLELILRAAIGLRNLRAKIR